MEVEGRKLIKSLYQGSDDVHDFPCSPCAKEEKNVAAAKHCVECDVNLCTTCLNHHSKFSVMKGHQLLDKVKTPGGQKPELPSQRCDKHGGNVIDVYCPSHDKVGCSTCIAVEHSTCQGISFIPDVAKHSRSSEELQQLETAISSLQTRFLALKQKKQKELDCSKREKDKLLQEIKSERKKINDQLDKMETELLNEVDASLKMKVQNIDSDIKEVEDTLASLGKDRQKIQAAKSENVSEKYVQVKLGHERQKVATDRLETLERSKKIGRLWFDPYHQITGSKNNIVGQIISYSAIEAERLFGEFDARIGTDGAICIEDMCLCESGSITMTDYDNKNIKKMNKSYSVTSFLTVNDNPFGICQIDMSLLAVTLTNKKKVQFISQKEPMTLHNSFNVGDRCRGVAYNGGLIYVCCGGSRDRKNNEGNGRIEVYTTKR
ncbi:transcription intermediary factor 1-beta-like [Mercenaria mercenaria]|uniref:transcription intermediary factor 1-beta-like n=1 Tax=Mercenaria mercenaria TaxID=6596 RepID=UPI00234E8425|nr:transcription intermediary factor 1-beta-like [Mercenaria mercenaria]